MIPDRGINISEAQSTEHIKEKHLQMIMDAKQAGREIPAVPVSQSIVGSDLAKSSVEASQLSMRKASKKSFLVPHLPFLKKDKNAENI